jgi:hypothetical protein
MPRGRGKGRAGDHQVSGTAGDRQDVEETVDHPGAVAVLRPPEFPRQDLAQRRRRLDRHHLPPAADELQRQPPRSRADLHDPVHVARQPGKHTGMEAFRADQPVVQSRFEPVQQLPGQGDVGLGITAPGRGEAA